jgi:Fe-S-cluster containining protein
MSHKVRLAEIQEELCLVRALKVDELAVEIQKVGFRCLRCGECCTGEDNSVIAFPFEIRRIIKATGDSWLETVEPPDTGEWDSEGNFHTLEWRIKKENGNCKFYSDVGCRIYETRPLLCRTYPFYLDGGVLRCSECRGLGGKIDSAKAMQIAASLVERSITEIREAIALLEKYEDFERGRPSKKGARIVHDSEGTHRIS